MDSICVGASCGAFAFLDPQDLNLQGGSMPRLSVALLRHYGPWVLAVAAPAPEVRLCPQQPVLVADDAAWRLGRAREVTGLCGLPVAAGRLLLLSGGQRLDLARELLAAELVPGLAVRKMAQTALGLRADGQVVLVAAPDLTLGEVADMLEGLGCLHGMSLAFGPDALVLRQQEGEVQRVVGDPACPVPALLVAGRIRPLHPDSNPIENLPGARPTFRTEPVAQPERLLARPGLITLIQASIAYGGPGGLDHPLAQFAAGSYFPSFRTDPSGAWYEATLYDGSRGWFSAAHLHFTPAHTPDARAVVIDPGHGGEEPGAIGATGLVEKAVNLDIALRVRTLLGARGIPALLTRMADETRSLDYRSDLATASGGRLLLSVHNNAGIVGALGTETYYQQGSEQTAAVRAESRRLGCLVQGSVLSALTTYGELHPTFMPHDRGVIARLLSQGDPRDYYHMLRESRLPVCLVEGAFISTPAEEACLGDDAFRQALAEGMVQGIVAYLQGESNLHCNLRGPYFGP